MKHLKTQKQLNKSSENLNISDVSDSYIQKLVSELFEIHFKDETCNEIWDGQIDIEEYAILCINQLIQRLK